MKKKNNFQTKQAYRNKNKYFLSLYYEALIVVFEKQQNVWQNIALP